MVSFSSKCVPVRHVLPSQCRFVGFKKYNRRTIIRSVDIYTRTVYSVHVVISTLKQCRLEHEATCATCSHLVSRTHEAVPIRARSDMRHMFTSGGTEGVRLRYLEGYNRFRLVG
eukprot:9488229-Pyramimonas_sp.AAC.1